MFLPRLARVVALSCTCALAAQWSTDPAQNLPICTRANQQLQAKLGPTSDGGCYVGWSDDSSGRFVVQLQRLDAGGVEQWVSGGIAIGPKALPSATTLPAWELLVDAEDHAVVLLVDHYRTGSSASPDLYLHRIAPSGAFVWGPGGRAITANASWKSWPTIAETSDGEIACLWAEFGLVPPIRQELRIQRFTRAGVARLPIGGEVTQVLPYFGILRARATAADSGACFATTMLGAQIAVQKLDVKGLPLWGDGRPVPVLEASGPGSSAELRLAHDGGGGLVLAWECAKAGGGWTTRVQRLDAAGREAFAHGGLDVTLGIGDARTPALVWHAGTQEIQVFWTDPQATPPAIRGQSIDASGQRLWGSSGVAIHSAAPFQLRAPVGAPFGDGAIVAVLEESLGANAKKLVGLRVDRAGVLAWPAPVVLSSVASDKPYLTSCAGASGVLVCAWSDLRNGWADVYAQNLNPDGTLGARLASTLAYGCAVNPPDSFLVGGRATIGTSCTLGVDNPLATQAVGSASLFLIAASPDAAFPCGTRLVGFGMAGHGASGELLVSTLAPLVVVPGPAWAGAGSPARIALPVPLELALVGQSLYAQGALVDASAGAIAPFGLARAARLTVGF